MVQYGLSIYFHNKYLGSFHDVNILHELHLYKNWHHFFVHIDEYIEYLLKDPNYMGEKMFVMRWVWEAQDYP
jgi:hypothetical protein